MSTGFFGITKDLNARLYRPSESLLKRRGMMLIRRGLHIDNAIGAKTLELMSSHKPKIINASRKLNLDALNSFLSQRSNLSILKESGFKLREGEQFSRQNVKKAIIGRLAQLSRENFEPLYGEKHDEIIKMLKFVNLEQFFAIHGKLSFEADEIISAKEILLATGVSRTKIEKALNHIEQKNELIKFRKEFEKLGSSGDIPAAIAKIEENKDFLFSIGLNFEDFEDELNSLKAESIINTAYEALEAGGELAAARAILESNREFLISQGIEVEKEMGLLAVRVFFKLLESFVDKGDFKTAMDNLKDHANKLKWLGIDIEDVCKRLKARDVFNNTKKLETEGKIDEAIELLRENEWIAELSESAFSHQLNALQARKYLVPAKELVYKGQFDDAIRMILDNEGKLTSLGINTNDAIEELQNLISTRISIRKVLDYLEQGSIGMALSEKEKIGDLKTFGAEVGFAILASKLIAKLDSAKAAKYIEGTKASEAEKIIFLLPFQMQLKIINKLSEKKAADILSLIVETKDVIKIINSIAADKAVPILANLSPESLNSILEFSTPAEIDELVCEIILYKAKNSEKY